MIDIGSFHFWFGLAYACLVIVFAGKMIGAFNRREQKGTLWLVFLLLTLIFGIIADAWWRGQLHGGL